MLSLKSLRARLPIIGSLAALFLALTLLPGRQEPVSCTVEGQSPVIPEVTLLQTGFSVEKGIQTAQPQQTLVSSDAANQTSKELPECFSFQYVPDFVSWETMDRLGYTHGHWKKMCRPASWKKNFDLYTRPVKVALEQITSKIEQVTGVPGLMQVATVYVLLFAVVVIGLGTTVLMPPTPEEDEEWEELSKMTKVPEREAWETSIFSWLWVTWPTPWMRRWGTCNDPDSIRIKPDELGMTDPEDEAAVAYKRFQKIWDEQIARNGKEAMTLRWVVLRFCGLKRVFSVTLTTALREVFSYIVPPLLTDYALYLLEHLEYEEFYGIPMTDKLFPCIVVLIGFMGMPLMIAIFGTVSYLISNRLSMQLQGALSAAVYQKALRLPGPAGEFELDIDEKEKTASSLFSRPAKKYSLVQLLTRDVSGNLLNIQFACAKLCSDIPVLMVLIILLGSRLGWATAVAFVTAFISLCLTYYFGRMQMVRMMWGQSFAGMRLAHFQETVFGIRVVKSYAWETACLRTIDDFRQTELGHMRWYWMWCGLTIGLYMLYPRVIILNTFASFLAFGGTVSAADIFVTVQILSAFRAAATSVGGNIPTILNAGPSFYRLDMFLKLPEARLAGAKGGADQDWVTVWSEKRLSTGSGNSGTTGGSTDSSRKRLLQVQGSFAFSAEGARALTDVDVRISEGELVAIIGEVGSGKTTLLQAMLGELEPIGDARLEIPSKMAYHAQVPFIFEATLKENVLYEAELDEERYHQALFCACLKPDLSILPGGDLVSIGSRGIALSGGQRARVSMARAAYSDTELVLLDDPFSSVDAPTGAHIMHHLVQGPLLEGRTRVVVTQPDVDRLGMFDRVILVSGGRVTAQGTPQEVMSTELFQSLLSTATAAGLVANKDLTDPDSPSASKGDKEAYTVGTPEGAGASKVEARALRSEENEGRASWSTLDFFASLGHYRLIVVCVLFNILYCVAGLLADIVFSHWTDNLFAIDQLGTSYSGLTSRDYLLDYVFWVGVCMVLFWICWSLGVCWTMRISTELHTMVVTRIFRAPIDRFFDRTPVGRIMNRMSNDLGEVDYGMFVKGICCVGAVFGVAVTLAYIHLVLPIFYTIISVPFYFLLCATLQCYWRVMTPLRYLTTVSRSELNIYITEVEAGSVAARAYQVSDRLISRQMAAMDQVLKADFNNGAARRWVTNRILLVFGFMGGNVVLATILWPFSMNLGNSGLCLMNVIGVIMMLDYFLDQTSSWWYELINMERAHEYTDLVQEAADRLDSDTKYHNSTVVVKRADFGSLEIVRDHAGLRIVRASDPLASPRGCPTCSNGTCPACLAKRSVQWADQSKIVLSASRDGHSLMPGEGGSTLQALAPNCPGFAKLDSWHRLVAVNQFTKDANKMAEELCKGTSEHVIVSVQSGWLADGARVVISDLVAGYGDAPANVLKGVNLTIERRLKLAVCGQTGCGKSTLLLCLLRILELRGGSIEIEGVDTRSLGLETLRSTLGLVPQDPVIFSGTVRKNLDPYEEFSTERLWEALKAVKLAAHVYKMGAGLDSPVKVDGGNLSFGQRQLLCIARMVLRQPALLLLDEATSAIDPATQEQVQIAIRSGFPDATTIAIAHRLETVMDFDQIVVMEQGLVVEKGTVDELRNLKGGHFARMLAARHM